MSKPSRRLSVSFTANPTLYVPQPPAGATVVGVVIRGLEIGALARCGDGSYVKINGDVVQPLNPHHVQAALDRARRPRPGAPSQSTTGAAPLTGRSVPVVIVKKRRRATVPA